MLFKEKASFSSKVRVITPVEYCEQLSIASINDLKKLLPDDIDAEANPDLLFNAFNAAVANRINANDDGIGTETALQISKNFVRKFTDIEHDRTQIVGHIISQGFSSFGSNEVLATESLAATSNPFNIALGAVVYKTVNPEFAKMLIESSDETSAKYNEISASWELGFNKYQILLGHRDVAEGELITDEAQIKEFAKLLRCYGGSGVTKDEVPVYRLILGGLPLGIGYTTNPAADVEGVIVKPQETEASREVIVVQLTEEEKKLSEANVLRQGLFDLAKEHEATFEDIAHAAKVFAASGLTSAEVLDRTRDALILSKVSSISAADAVAKLVATLAAFKKDEKSAETFSQTTNPPVKKDSNMELKALSDITDDSLKQFSAANVLKFISEEILKSNEIFKADIAKKDAEATTLAEKVAEFEKTLKASDEVLKKTNEELAKVQDAQAKETADRLFNERMASFNEKYDLDEKLSSLIAKEIAGMDDAQFTAAFERYELLLSSKVKKTEAAAVAVASVVPPVKTAEQVLEAVVADPVAPVAKGAQTEPTKFQQFAEAFSGDAVKITSRR